MCVCVICVSVRACVRACVYVCVACVRVFVRVCGAHVEGGVTRRVLDGLERVGVARVLRLRREEVALVLAARGHHFACSKNKRSKVKEPEATHGQHHSKWQF